MATIIEEIAPPSVFDLTDEEIEIIGVANGFLINHVGHVLVAGDPYRLPFAVRSVWVLPVLVSYLHTGPIGTVGVIAVDDEAKEVIAWTPISEMKAATKKLRESREPQLTEQWAAFMNQHSPSNS